MMLLDGKPLVLHSVDAAISSSLFDKVVITTDDPNIKMLYTPADIIDRPEELSADDIPLAPVILHAMEKAESFYNIKFNTITTLQPTSPLRHARHIREAHARFNSLKADSLLSVKEELHSIWLSDNGYGVPLVYSKVNRQYARPHYLGNGAIFITSRRILVEERDRIGGKIAIYPMDEYSSLDVHSLWDVELARWGIKQRGQV